MNLYAWFKKKTTYIFLLLVIALGSSFYFASDCIINFYFRMTPYIHFLSYEKDKALISPYFDEAFYRREYAADLLEAGGIEPIDHFMQRSGRFGGGSYDPNPWFNATLYSERLWPCSGNTFLDFLTQPKLQVNDDAKEVEIFANNDEFYRAWMAVEGFMRKQKFKVSLVLPESYKNKIPMCFEPMIKRGLEVKFSKNPALSFYKSSFLKNPDEFGVTELTITENPPAELAVTRFRKKPGYEYLMHRIYNYSRWEKAGRINPCMLNFAHFCFEPIEFSPLGRTEYEFKKNMQRLAPGFDLMLINSDIGTKNLRIVPGYMFSHIENEQIPDKKDFEVSFLLSLGGKGTSSFRTRGSFVYYFRKVIWDNEPKFTVPTKFYISRRDINKYPESMKERVLPTDSKKWIFGSQFTIAIENSRQDYYFSEKLIGCFMALSVPIYIGCPNVTDYFDERGMLIAKDPDDVLRIANSLTRETYAKMLPYLIENKKRAEKLVKLEDSYIEEFSQKLLA